MTWNPMPVEPGTVRVLVTETSRYTVDIPYADLGLPTGATQAAIERAATMRAEILVADRATPIHDVHHVDTLRTTSRIAYADSEEGA